MLQFYFLSVLLNVLAGLVLVYGVDLGAGGGGEAPAPGGDDFALDGPGAADAGSSVDDDIFAGLDDGSGADSAPDGGAGSGGKKRRPLFPEDVRKNLAATGAAFLNDQTFRLVVGVLAAVVGLIKLFYTVQNDVVVVGDLVPALAGLAGGASLVLEYYANGSEYGITLPSFLETLLFDGRKYLGVFCIVAGLLHFIFPRLLFL